MEPTDTRSFPNDARRTDDLRRDRRLRRVRRVHKDLSREGDTARTSGVSVAPDRACGPLYELRRVRGGLSGFGVRRSPFGGDVRRVHPIETESYRIMRELVDLSGLGPLSRAVAERTIHASADLEYAETLVLDEVALRGGLDALRDGAAVVTDVGMVAAGVTGRETRCFISDPRTRRTAEDFGITRSAAGFRLAADEVGPGAVWVVGNAPTALFELLEAGVEPALVVGLPVGFVGAAESKEALIVSGLPSVANRGRKGGSAVAAAALNALIYYEEE